MSGSALLESSAAGNAFPFGGGPKSEMKAKRKTPSELRGEQLKRRSTELPRNQKRVSEHYPVKKSSERCRLPNVKAKDTLVASGKPTDFINPCTANTLPDLGESSLPCDKDDKPNILECSNPFAKSTDNQAAQKAEKNDQHNVVERHLGKKSSDSAKTDMEKALKGFFPQQAPLPVALADSSWKLVDTTSASSSDHYSKFSIPDNKPPLDFTMKTSLRLVSSSSMKWCHRLSANLATIDLKESSPLYYNKDQNSKSTPGLNATAELLFSKALHSWTYPQSSLPPLAISALAVSSKKGETDFLGKRQQDWENSFRNLYYLLRKSFCNIFYVCTANFIALFVGGNFSGQKRSCNAYISQSTRGLRSLLKKHDICFSMPLCRAEVEQASDDDLVELSEIEKRNFGQTFHLDALSGVDNTPQSLLAFIGNENAHCLYDFLLNYRFFLNSLTAVDVPVLCAPVPFQNASLCVPEVRCKEVKRADLVPTSSGSDPEEAEGLPATGICYSIEIKDTVLPPWIVSGVCVALGSNQKVFEASFTTDPASLGLNAALDSVYKKSDSPELSKSLTRSGEVFGIPESTLAPCLRSSSMKHLKYSHGSYLVDTNHI